MTRSRAIPRPAPGGAPESGVRPELRVAGRWWGRPTGGRPRWVCGCRPLPGTPWMRRSAAAQQGSPDPRDPEDRGGLSPELLRLAGSRVRGVGLRSDPSNRDGHGHHLAGPEMGELLVAWVLSGERAALPLEAVRRVQRARRRVEACPAPARRAAGRPSGASFSWLWPTLPR